MNLRRMLDDWVSYYGSGHRSGYRATLSVGYALSWASTLPLAAVY